MHSLCADKTEKYCWCRYIGVLLRPGISSRIIRRMKEVPERLPGAMVEQKYVRMDGKMIDVETMAFPCNYRGESCVQVVFRDITERKQTETRDQKE